MSKKQEQGDDDIASFKAAHRHIMQAGGEVSVTSRMNKKAPRDIRYASAVLHAYENPPRIERIVKIAGEAGFVMKSCLTLTHGALRLEMSGQEQAQSIARAYSHILAGLVL